MSTKVLFLFQDSIQDPTLHLIVISPSFPLFCDYFVIFPCSWIWLFWKVPGQMFWNAPQVCIYLIFYQHFIGDIGFFSLFFFFWKISQKWSVLLIRKYQILSLFTSCTVFPLSNSRMQLHLYVCLLSSIFFGFTVRFFF